MLTQDAVRSRLDTIADEVSQAPGIYYELYSRLFSARVQRWIHGVPSTDAAVIAQVAQNDPDYLGNVDSADLMPAIFSAAQFNPDWDVTY